MPSHLKSMQPAHNMSRLPPLIDIAYCPVRHHDWPAVVSAHEGLDAAFVWSAENKALAPKAMRPEGDKDCAPVTAVAISSCGNYCVLGLANGSLHRFNLQSQLHRGPIPRAQIPRASDIEAGLAKADSSPPPKAHQGRVCGVEISVSGLVISLASHPRDCVLRTWKLMTHEPAFSVPLHTSGAGQLSGVLLRMHGALVAAPLDNGALLVVDLNGASVVRSFSCGVPATDVAFSSDGRWLAAALRDGGLRVFDLLAARCVDSFVFARPALSLCFSPSGAFLLTSHAKGNAIQVWANKFLFDPSLSAPLLRPEPKAPIKVDELVGTDGEGDDAVPDEAEEGASDDEEEGKKSAPSTSTVPLEPSLLTLSDVPPAKWMATLHLDVVRERNKAAEPPKPLPNAPFFLPTALDGLTPRFAAPLGAEDGAGENSAPVEGQPKHLRDETSVAKGFKFQNLIRKNKYDEALAFLRAQTPSGVHLAIEELGPMAGGTMDELKAGLELFGHHLRKAHLADEVQAYLSIFLQAHGEELMGDPETKVKCQDLGRALEGQWSALNRQCQKVRCFLGMLTHTQSQW
mmetsp:Transcript_42133/g.108558  ORF Transcript_42133/g.108558 Transcript_42133/m.108558 type:complete len:572 (-) Transcript_42133:64-1779(-)